jgi:acyl carrier protein
VSSSLSPPPAPSPIRTRSQFEQSVVHFVNEVLPRLDSRRTRSFRVEAETHLFESGILDSLNVLHLIGLVEGLTGRRIPSRMVVMKHFRSAAAIAEAFWPSP